MAAPHADYNSIAAIHNPFENERNGAFEALSFLSLSLSFCNAIYRAIDDYAPRNACNMLKSVIPRRGIRTINYMRLVYAQSHAVILSKSTNARHGFSLIARRYRHFAFNPEDSAFDSPRSIAVSLQ